MDLTKFKLVPTKEEMRDSFAMWQNYISIDGNNYVEVFPAGAFAAGFARGMWYARQVGGVDERARLENVRTKSSEGSNPSPAYYTELTRILHDTPLGYDTVREIITPTMKKLCEIWLVENNMTGYVRVELSYAGEREHYSSRYRFGMYGKISVHNGIGGVSNKQRWLNKISVDVQSLKVNHACRTDPSYLKPADTEFKKYIHNLLVICAKITETGITPDEPKGD